MPKNYTQRSTDSSGLQIPSANYILTEDGSGLCSPVVTSDVITTVHIPDNAYEIVICSAVDIRISEKPDMSSYYLIPSGKSETIGVAATDEVYICANSISGNAYFRFSAI